MSGIQEKPPGINKHLYSTNPDSIVGENIYSSDKSSINKEESYQTLDNRTVPVDTGEKINPFNVKGVPGCKECGGSGWKETKRHPHPCNECAKRTVPVIDTYLTKVGHTSTPVVIDQITQPEVQTEVVTSQTVETVPVTKEVHHFENVPVTTKVPVTRYEEVTRNVAVDKVDYVTEEVPVVTTTTQTLNTEGETHNVISEEEYRNKYLLKDSHEHDDEAKIGYSPFVGLPGCKDCGGEGWRLSKLTGKRKPCDHCVRITGNCPLCGNTGRRLDKDKKCNCIYSK